MPLPSLADRDKRQESVAVKLALALLRVSQAVGAALGSAAHELGLSPLQLQILLDLLHPTRPPVLALHLAERYGLKPATLSEALAGLARRGLVRRRVAAEDGRRRELSLSARGQALAERIAARLERLVAVAEALPAETRASMLAGLIELIRGFADAGWIATDRLCVTCRFFVRDRRPGAKEPHWCRLIETALGAGDLRVDCPEHESPVVHRKE